MLPPINDQRWSDLVTGKIQHNFKSVPAAMMISRHKRETSRDCSLENIECHIKEAYEFFLKFEVILKEDIKAIFG